MKLDENGLPLKSEQASLATIASELTQIRQNLEALVAFQEWRAGLYRQEKSGRLPDGFPAKLQLEAAGIKSLDDIPRSSKQLRRIDGIEWDEATAILSHLSKQQKEVA